MGSLVSYFHLPVLLHLLKLANQRRLYSLLLTSERLPRCSGASSWPALARCLMRKSCICPTQDTADAPADSELLYAKRWVLYAKRPFGGPHQSYLAKYTHRAALSNRRIIAIDAKRRTVTFTYRDYLHGSQLKELTLSVLEFIRRFSSHILPSGLVRIRHYESSATMVKNKPNRPLNQSCQQGCAHPRQTTFDNISSFALRDC